MSKKNEYVFTKKDYNNANGMLTSVWGPSFWHVLHTISVNYPVKPSCDDKQHYKTQLHTSDSTNVLQENLKINS